MNNYEYIIACLPVIKRDEAALQAADAGKIIAEIKEQCSVKDNALVDFLLDGFNPEKLDRDFYLKALSHGNPFIRDYFSYDLILRNTRTIFLNKALGRDEDTDTVILDDGLEDWETRKEVNAVLENPDTLERERGLDELMWEKCEELTQLRVFDINVILSFIARLKIVDRWAGLDPETGRGLFYKLIDEIKKRNRIWQRQEQLQA